MDFFHRMEGRKTLQLFFFFQREVKLPERVLEGARVRLLLGVTLRAVLPVDAPFQPQQLRHHPPSKLQIEAESRRQRQHQFLLFSLLLSVCIAAAAVVKGGLHALLGPPDPDAEVVARLRRAVSDRLGLEGGGVLFVLGLDFEGGVHEALLDQVGGHGQELPVDVDALRAADFPGHGTQVAFAGGDEEGV